MDADADAERQCRAHADGEWQRECDADGQRPEKFRNRVGERQWHGGEGKCHADDGNGDEWDRKSNGRWDPEQQSEDSDRQLDEEPQLANGEWEPKWE